MKRYLSNNPENICSSREAYLYGTAFADGFLIHDKRSLPRYGYLTRKVMRHYLGDYYNPHLHGITHEPFLRYMIKEIISYKVFNRLSTYDWEWIDHSLRKYFTNSFGHTLFYSQQRIDAGLVKDAIRKCQPSSDFKH